MPEKKATIRLKFCGGCNPRYDRSAMAVAIQKHCGHQVRLVTDPDIQVTGAIVIAGCQTACVDQKQFQGLPVVWVTGPQKVDEICCMLIQNQKK